MTNFRELQEQIRKSSEEFDEFYEKVRLDAARKMADRMDEMVRDILKQGENKGG